MTAPRAADLPVGSVVASQTKAWIRYRTGSMATWECADAINDDSMIDQAIADGAQVLRVGDGSDQ